MNDNLFMYGNYETFDKVYKNSNKTKDQKPAKIIQKKSFEEDNSDLRKQQQKSKQNVSQTKN